MTVTSQDDRGPDPVDPDEDSPEEVDTEEVDTDEVDLNKADTDEAVFRRIVEGYGTLPSVEDVESQVRRELGLPEPAVPGIDSRVETASADEPEPWDGEGEFVPPPLPPAPPTTWERLLALAGLCVPVVVILVAVAMSWSIPRLLGYALIGWAIGGFAYLVRTMSQEPRDPGDDGARL